MNTARSLIGEGQDSGGLFKQNANSVLSLLCVCLVHVIVWRGDMDSTLELAVRGKSIWQVHLLCGEIRLLKNEDESQLVCFKYAFNNNCKHVA